MKRNCSLDRFVGESPYEDHTLRALRHRSLISPFSSKISDSFHTAHSPPSISLQMASFAASSVSFSAVPCSLKQNQVSSLRKATLSFSGKGFTSYRMPALRFRVACAAKPETVSKVVEIVKKQLALPDDRDVCGESKFATLGADSLDTVEIVMGLEEEFGISVEEESAQSITTVQEAADLIEDLLAKN